MNARWDESNGSTVGDDQETCILLRKSRPDGWQFRSGRREKRCFELGEFLCVAFDAIGFGKCFLAAENDDAERHEEKQTNDHDGEEIRKSFEDGEQFDEWPNVLLLVEISSGNRSDHTT